MVKANKKEFVCRECGAISSKWSGKCEDCGAWNTIEEHIPVATSNFTKLPSSNNNARVLEFKDSITDTFRISTSIGELDQVLGGGIVPGSVTLIGGDPGIGKSTLILQLLSNLTNTGLGCVYVSGEESLSQIALRAKRLKVEEADIKMIAATNLEPIIATVKAAENIHFLVIDSIQTMYMEQVQSAPGTVSQVRASAHELIRLAKDNNIAVAIIGHVTKEGQIAGPKVLEHMVDTVLYFEGERGQHFRILRSVKNRFGGINEIGVFEMGDTGLREVSNPSALFLGERSLNTNGACIFAGMEGTRPILIEVQALVAPTFMATPRRAVIGWDSNRLAMVIAVLATRFGLNLTDKEVYLNIAGGLEIEEPAADLAVAAALISAAIQVDIPSDTAVFGEIGLGGEIRSISQADSRVKEAAKLGFTRIILPDNGKLQELQATTSAKIIGLKHIKELKKILFS